MWTSFILLKFLVLKSFKIDLVMIWRLTSLDLVFPFMDMINYLSFFCRHVVSIQQRKFLPAEDIQLSKFLLSVIAGSQSAIFPSSNSIIGHGCTAEVKSVPKCNSLWDVQAVAFDLLSQAITSLGSYFPVDVWKSTIQVETILLHLWFLTNAFVG